jgi:ribosomal protein S18 acetylase RimI-like enzyme
MEIRKATPKDAPGIAKVHVTTWQFAYRSQLPDAFLDSLSVEKRILTWQDILSNPTPRSTVWIAEAQDSILGFCAVGPSQDDDTTSETGHLYAIYIDPKHMGQGIGSQLMAKGLESLKAQGFTETTLWVLDTNEKTRKFYESKGWSEDGAEKVEPGEGFVLNETRYRLSLTTQ